jgi:hypothetical protein
MKSDETQDEKKKKKKKWTEKRQPQQYLMEHSVVARIDSSDSMRHVSHRLALVVFQRRQLDSFQNEIARAFPIWMRRSEENYQMKYLNGSFSAIPILTALGVITSFFFLMVR